MNARQMAAMAEATRLTRQGRLLEATALEDMLMPGNFQQYHEVAAATSIPRPRCAPARGHN